MNEKADAQKYKFIMYEYVGLQGVR